MTQAGDRAGRSPMYTRAEFERFRREQAAGMAADTGLQDAARELLVRADRHHWIHQTTWFGEPILQLPQDMFALQEIIFTTRPRFVVEVGVAWGGSLLFYSTLLHALGEGQVIGIDVFIPADLRERLARFGRISERIQLLEGSSIDAAMVERIRALIGASRDVLVVLDSDHTHDHVLAELRQYSPLVGVGHYLVCGDTIVEDIPVQEHRPRRWGPGNNPKTALDQFLRETDRFEVDAALEAKLLFSCNPRGYLRCINE